MIQKTIKTEQQELLVLYTSPHLDTCTQKKQKNKTKTEMLPGNIPTWYPTMIHQLRPLKHGEAN